MAGAGEAGADEADALLLADDAHLREVRHVVLQLRREVRCKGEKRTRQSSERSIHKGRLHWEGEGVVQNIVGRLRGFSTLFHHKKRTRGQITYFH